jgi:hypothetical protein
MKSHGHWKQLVAGCLLAVALGGSPGCLSFLHPVTAPPEHVFKRCQSLPPECRDHVYIFLMNGLDPLRIGNMNGVKKYIECLGFTRTFYGELIQHWQFKSQIRRIHQEDPQAHIVLVGYSLGGSTMHSLAHTLHDEGINVDLLVYLDAKCFLNNLHHRPDNVCHVVKIVSLAQLWDGGLLERAENVRIPDVWHFGAPTHQGTLETLALDLAEIAARPAVAPHP